MSRKFVPIAVRRVDGTVERVGSGNGLFILALLTAGFWLVLRPPSPR